MSHKTVIRWFGLLLAGLAATTVASAGVPSPTRTAVEQAVIAAIPAWHGQKATILKHLDLTRPFGTVSPWALVIAQDPGPAAAPNLEGHGPIEVCFVKVLTPRCMEK